MHAQGAHYFAKRYVRNEFQKNDLMECLEIRSNEVAQLKNNLDTANIF